MGRQYFAEPMVPIVVADLATISGASEAAIWPVSPYTAFLANQLQPGQIYRFEADGVISTASSSPGTLTLTPRWGTTSAGTSMGASAASPTLTTSITNAPWSLRGKLTARTVGSAAPAVINGVFHCDQVGIQSLCFGGPITNIDTTTPQGIWLGATLGSASDNITCRQLIVWAEN